MKKYEELEMDVVLFSAEDVITWSGDDLPVGNDQGPWN